MAEALPALRKRRVRPRSRRVEEPAPTDSPARSDVAADNPVPDAAVLGRPGSSRASPLADYASYLDERATFLGQWGLQAARAATARRTRSWSRPRAGRGCGCGWTGSRPRACWRRPSSTATSRAVSEGDDLVVLHARGRAGGRGAAAVHLPAPAPRPAPVPGRLLPAARVRRDRRRRASTWSPWAAGSPRRRRSCSPRTPTATTSSCTACRCSSPRRWPSSGTRGSARSSASAPTTTRRPGRDPAPGLPRLALLLRLPGLPGPGGPGQAGRAAATRTRIGVELSEELQLHPEQSTDAIVVHHPEAKYFNAT